MPGKPAASLLIRLTGLPLALIVAMIVGACSGTAPYQQMSQAGQGFAQANTAVLTEYRALYLDSRSEMYLADESMRGGPGLPARQVAGSGFSLGDCQPTGASPSPAALDEFARNQCRDLARVRIVNELIAHSRLLGEYFARLGALATSDAPETAGAASKQLVAELTEVGKALNRTVPEQAGALAPLTQAVVAAAQRAALQRELDRNKDNIRGELRIQANALQLLRVEMRREGERVFNLRFRRLVSSPARTGKSGADADRWIEDRRTLLLATDQAAGVEAAQKALQSLSDTFEVLVAGGNPEQQLEQLLNDTSLALDIVKPLAGR